MKRITTLVLAGILLAMSCTKENKVTPTVIKVEPGEGAGNEVITATGSGLKDIASITFDLGSISTDINPNFNTDGVIVFRVPAAANVGTQNIIFTNTSGYQFKVPFKVLAVPSITSAFPQEWEAGSNITLFGNYMENVDDVTIDGTTLKATIISKEATKLVIKMPAAEVKSAKLIVHNTAGSTTTSLLFINMDKQLKFFTEGLASGMQNWSWCNAVNSTDFAASGATSFKAIYSANTDQGLSFHYDFDIKMSDYQTLSFWVKGGVDVNIIQVGPDGVSAGTAVKREITVPANVWTHFVMPITGNFDGVTCTRLNFQIAKTPNEQSLYFDNVILVY